MRTNCACCASDKANAAAVMIGMIQPTYCLTDGPLAVSIVDDG
jgi:hypothetical protein